MKAADNRIINLEDIDDRIILLSLFVFTLLIRIFHSSMIQVIANDSVKIIYTSMVFSDLGNLSLKDFIVDVHPLFPFLISLLSKTGLSYELSGKMLSVFFGSVTVVPLYLFTKKGYSKTVGVYTCFLFAIHPYLYINSSELLRDSTYIFFLASAVFLAWRGFDEGKYRFFVFAGITSALAYLTKAEGVFIIFVMLIFIWLQNIKIRGYNFKVRILTLLSFLSVILIVVIPYLIVLQVKADSFTLSFSKPFEMILNSHMQVANFEDFFERLAYRSGNIAFDKFQVFVGILCEAIFPPFLFLLAMHLVRFWTREKITSYERYIDFIIFSFFALIFVYFNSFCILSRRYFLGTVAIMTVFMGRGMELLFTQLFKLNKKKITVLKTIGVGDILVLLIILSMFFAHFFKGTSDWRYDKVGLKIAGEQILEEFGSGKKILSNDSRTAYYAKGQHFMLDQSRMKEIEMGVDGELTYDFVVIYRKRNNEHYTGEFPGIFDSGKYDLLKVKLPPDAKEVYVYRLK